jgi:hypothetical protein
MSFNHLLLWLSAKQQGSWQQFRSAVEELDLREDGEPDDTDRGEGASSTPAFSLYQKLRFALERLGHAEFSPRDNLRWRVVPPSAALLADCDETVGVLCGARSLELLEELSRCPDFHVDTQEVDDMPDRILLRTNSAAQFVKGARLIGLHLQRSAPLTLLSVLPSIRDRRGWVVSEVPQTPGWTIHRFSESQLRWTEVQQVATSTGLRSGLFRFAMEHQRFYYALLEGRCFQVPVQVGKYAVLRRRRGIVRYDSVTRVLSVRPICRPPLLIERALVLCSGLLPSFDGHSGELAYRDVPCDVARLVSRMLHQELG